MIIDQSGSFVLRRRQFGRNESAQGTLAVIPNLRNMARKGQVPKIVTFEGGDFTSDDDDACAAGAGDIMADGFSLSPERFRSKFSQKFIIDSLIHLLCKYESSDEESHRKLYEVFNFLHFDSKKALASGGRNSETSLSFLRTQFQQTFLGCLSKAKNLLETQESNLTAGALINFTKFLSDGMKKDTTCTILLYEESKLNSMFTKLQKIAEGGGGVVYRALHKLDECWYAIKIIRVPTKPRVNVLQEAKYLASLEHPNIVNYKTVWMDHCPEGSEFFDSNNSSPISTTKDSSSEMKNSTVNDDVSEGSDSIVFKNSNQSSVKQAVVKKPIVPPRKILRSVSLESRRTCDWNSESALALYNNTNGGRYSRRHFSGQPIGSERDDMLCVKRPDDCRSCKRVLVIQMELCRSTLKDWLQDRIPKNFGGDVFSLVDFEKTLSILKSILQGIQFIHDKKVIHRDLKPSNIFFDKHNKIKIGDFGLAAQEAPIEIVTIEEIDVEARHTAEIGTKFYAAPEQITSYNYDFKVDMFSLGVIIIELFYPFGTMMEANEVVQQFKNKSVPKVFEEKWPRVTALILKLLSEDPKVRPSAHEVLKSDLFSCSKQPVIPEIKITDCSDDEEDDLDGKSIEEIKKLYKKSKSEICNLRKQVDILEKENIELKKRINL